MTLDEIKTNYKPKEGWELYIYQSKETGNYVALVMEKVSVNRFSKEYASAARKNISTQDLDKYLEFLLPYLDKRS